MPPLAVGLGMYLPLAVTLTIVVGAVAGWAYDRSVERRSGSPAAAAGAKQLGVLLASGMIVGESLVGVVLSFVVYFTGNQTPLALVSDSFAEGPGQWIGGIAFVITMVALYGWLKRLVSSPAARA